MVGRALDFIAIFMVDTVTYKHNVLFTSEYHHMAMCIAAILEYFHSRAQHKSVHFYLPVIALPDTIHRHAIWFYSTLKEALTTLWPRNFPYSANFHVRAYGYEQ